MSQTPLEQRHPMRMATTCLRLQYSGRGSRGSRCEWEDDCVARDLVLPQLHLSLPKSHAVTTASRVAMSSSQWRKDSRRT